MTIKEIRELTGLTQKQFAEKYHITFSSIRNWESGHRTCPDYVAELLEFRVREDLKMEKTVSMSTIDEMKELKDVLKSVSAKNAEDMLKHLSEEQKDCLLRLYVYENK